MARGPTGKAPLGGADTNWVRRRLEAGESYRSIANKIGMSHTTVMRWWKRETKKSDRKGSARRKRKRKNKGGRPKKKKKASRQVRQEKLFSDDGRPFREIITTTMKQCIAFMGEYPHDPSAAQNLRALCQAAKVLEKIEDNDTDKNVEEDMSWLKKHAGALEKEGKKSAP